MSSYRIIVSIAIAAASLAGCNHDQVQTQNTEQGQNAGVENIEAKPETAKAENAGDAESGPAEPTMPDGANAEKKGDTASKPCGPTTLNAADAEKWDCVPEIGYWCTDLAGCPVDGQIAKVGTRLAMVRPLPQGTQYEYLAVDMSDSGIHKDEDNSILHLNSHRAGMWQCANDAGCKCGADMIKKYGICYGDTYRPEAALPNSPCNEQNCQAFCRDNQCVCGDSILTNVKTEGLLCKRNHQICINKNGCEYHGTKYSQYESWTDYRLICNEAKGCSCGSASCKLEDTCLLPQAQCITPSEFICAEWNGCPCGNITCNNSDRCITAESKCIDWKGNERTTDKPVDDKQAAKDIPECSSPDGCKCGSQLCPEYYKCIDDLCVYVSDAGDGSEGHYAFYCDKPEGCSCGSPFTICPTGSVCDRWHGDTGWTNAFGYWCAKVDTEKVKDEKSLFEFLKNEGAGDFLYEIRNSDTKNYIFSEAYYGNDKDVAHHQNFILDKKDGKDIGIYVVCSQPGCDCNGVPLENDYLCVEQHVVFAHTESDDFGLCPWPYYGFTHDMPSTGGSCDIADNLYEQICFNPKGCSCGSGTIWLGDTCVDGHARCSTLKPRAGCTCDREKPEKGYGCYHEQLICQTDACKCHGKTIHLGDICTKDGVICGANSNTTGCLCGETPLREGYRCFQKEQICACHTQIEERDETDEDSEDRDETDEDSKPCTCQCGEKTIERGAVCKDDNHEQPQTDDPAHAHVDFDRSKCGNRGEMYNYSYVMHNDRKYWVDDSFPELAWLACTCGTGMEAPGDGYACGMKGDTKGNGSEFMTIPLYAGWMCQRIEGCACGENTCDPGALCVTDKDGSKSCSKFNNLDGNCGGHELPIRFVYENGYECYDPFEDTHAKGWYCGDVDGCACGDVICEQYQMCLSPGYCSKNKITSESEIEKLERPRIEYCDDFDCEYNGTSSIQVTPWAPDTPNPLLSYVPDHSAFIAATRRESESQLKAVMTILKGFVETVEDGLDIAANMPNDRMINLSDWGIDPSGKADAALYAHDDYVVIHITVNDEEQAEKHVEDWLTAMRSAMGAMAADAGNSVMHLRDVFTKVRHLYLGYHVGEGVLTLIIFDKKIWKWAHNNSERVAIRLTEDILRAPHWPYQQQESDNHGAITFRIGHKKADAAVLMLPMNGKKLDEQYIKSHFMTE